MSKYVIELGEDAKAIQSISVTSLGNVYVDSWYVENLEELNSDYINEHFGDLQDTAYQRGLEDGKAQSKRGCEGCRYECENKRRVPCILCSDNIKLPSTISPSKLKSQWTAKDTYYDIIRNSIHNWVTELNVKLEDISKVLEDMKHDD